MKETQNISRGPAMGPGLVIALLWLAMAAVTIASSIRAYGHDRAGWGLGWGLVGFLLLAGGLAALGGTLWHNFRVKRTHH